MELYLIGVITTLLGLTFLTRDCPHEGSLATDAVAAMLWPALAAAGLLLLSYNLTQALRASKTGSSNNGDDK